MAQNITIQGASYTDVPSVELPKTGGGTASFTDVTDTTATAGDVASGKYFYDALGQKTLGTATGMVLISTLPKAIFKLKNTSFASWTPSSTAAVILATQELGTFTATNLASNDYWTRVKVFVDVVYNEGTSTAKGMFKKMVCDNWYGITRRASNVTNLNAGTRNYNVAESVTNTYIINYYNTSWTISYSSAYGIYPSNTAPAVSSTSATSPTITVKSPVINAKCNATYFSTAMAGNVDQENSTITFVGEVYRAAAGYTRSIVNTTLIDLWNNGL